MYPKSLEIIQELEKKAPRKFAMKEDNVGLQIGSYENEVVKCMITLDVTEEVLDEALEHNVDLIISHHPFLYQPINEINFDTLQGKLISRAIKNKITIYSAHTNLDVAPEIGVSNILASRLGLDKREVLYPTYDKQYYTLVVFVPRDYEEQVREAISEKGAGWIGNYSHCTFMTSGQGTFKPLQGSRPFLGKRGELSRVEELRIETILPEEIIETVLKSINEAHPYEEVAYDIYPLYNCQESYGLGLVGIITPEMTANEFLKHVKEKLRLERLRVIGVKPDNIKKVAICGGSGEKLIDQAFSKGADVYITGDIKYHAALDAMREDKFIIDAGHYATEFPLLDELKKYLNNTINKNYKTEFFVSRNVKDPFEIFYIT